MSEKINSVVSAEKTVQKRNFNGIDLFKFICSILVFSIHIVPFQDNAFAGANIVNYFIRDGVCRVAVPFFFVASGFFLFRKMELHDLKTDVIKNYCMRIMQLFGVWYFLLFIGPKYHMWYLGATGVAVVLVSLCLKKLSFRCTCVIALVVYLMGLMLDVYVDLLSPYSHYAAVAYPIKAFNFVFGSARNGFFFGFVFVLMGVFFAHYKDNIKPLVSFCGLAVSMALLLAEAYFVRRYTNNPWTDMYLSLLPAVFFMFSFAKNIRLKDRPIYRKLRVIGVFVYFMHLLVRAIVLSVGNVILSVSGFDIKPYVYIITLVLTLLISVFLEWLSRKEKFKWINWFV